jgi:hypothetical protein
MKRMEPAGRLAGALALILLGVAAPPGPAGGLDAETMTFEDVQQVIQSNGVDSIEDLLPLLPPNYRSEFTLMQRTFSLQAATFESPRVIMTGPHAILVMAFNGDPNAHLELDPDGTPRSPNAIPAAYHRLEIIQFRAATKTFEFREIDFSNPAGPIFSNANPPICLTCHLGPNPRPNWETYSNWPGAYGSSTDTDNGIAEFVGVIPYELVIYLIEEYGLEEGICLFDCDSVFCGPDCDDSEAQAKLDAERTAVQDFLASHLTHPRYQHLVNVAEHYAITNHKYDGRNNAVVNTRRGMSRSLLNLRA